MTNATTIQIEEAIIEDRKDRLDSKEWMTKTKDELTEDIEIALFNTLFNDVESKPIINIDIDDLIDIDIKE